MNPEDHWKSVEISLHLGRICALCAWIEFKGGRHWFAEQPADSSLNLEPEWVDLAHLPGATWCYMNMCMAGLVSRRGFALRKTGKFEEAEKYYLAGLKIKPNHNGINEYLGELYVKTGRIELAKERLSILKNCNCDEYAELKEVIEKN